MEILRRFRFLPCLLSPIFWTALAQALSPDPKLVSLIPHSAQVVDGTGVSPSRKERRKFLIFSQENAVDLDDFRSLVAVNDSKFIRQIFLVGGSDSASSRFEHSLLAIGNFNQAGIYRSAIQNGAQAREYRSLSILEILPFSRGPKGFKDVRWLAIVGSDLALFGTVLNVREELDHYLNHDPANPDLLQTLSRFNHDDEMWVLLPNISQYKKGWQDLGLLEPRFLEVAPGISQLAFGIRYRRKIRLDYEFTSPIRIAGTTMAEAPPSERLGSRKVGSLFSNRRTSAGAGAALRVISLSRAQYEKWLVVLSTRAEWARTSSDSESSSNPTSEPPMRK